MIKTIESVIDYAEQIAKIADKLNKEIDALGRKKKSFCKMSTQC